MLAVVTELKFGKHLHSWDLPLAPTPLCKELLPDSCCHCSLDPKVDTLEKDLSSVLR
jgi:hypothetical protein